MFFPEDYTIVLSFFPRLLGVIYFFAFFPLFFQMRALFGKKGILPIQRYLNRLESKVKRKPFIRVPTLFWLNQSDFFLLATVSVGVLSAFLLILGVKSSVLIALLILIHLSIISTGQDFLSFGWEMFFLEISYNTLFLTLTPDPNPFVWISLNLLIFRFHVQAGASKLLSRDPSWENFSALSYHYETQPLPHALAWYLHKLPITFHKFSTAFTLFVELFVPFLILGTQQMRLAAFVLFFLLQFFIILSGNYSYLNYLTLTLITLLVSNHYLSFWFDTPESVTTSYSVQVIASLGGFAFIILQLIHLINHFFPSSWTRKVVYWLYPFHFANRYGIFAVMTTSRYEVVIKGSDDQVIWEEYLFYFKPSEVNRKPRLISPFHPRLDWQVWFLPFTSFEEASWFHCFLKKVLEGERQVTKLLRYNPFQDHPPKYVKAEMYLYQYSARSQKHQWWVRNFIGDYSPVLTIDNFKKTL